VHNCPTYRYDPNANPDDEPSANEPMKPKAAGSPNDEENAQAGAAASQVGLNDAQAQTLHRIITGHTYTFEQLLEIARGVANGDY